MMKKNLQQPPLEIKKIYSSLIHDETTSNSPISFLGRYIINLWPNKQAAVK